MTGSAGEHSPSDHAAVPPIGWHEIAGMTPLLVLIVLIGIFPRPFLDQIRPAVARIDQNVRAQVARAAREHREAAVPQVFAPRTPAKKKGSGRPGAKTNTAPGSAKTAPASVKDTPKR